MVKKDPAAVALGKKGGEAWAASLSPGELSAAGRKAVKARWDAYYELHPDKLKAKLERAKKARRKAAKA